MGFNTNPKGDVDDAEHDSHGFVGIDVTFSLYGSQSDAQCPIASASATTGLGSNLGKWLPIKEVYLSQSADYKKGKHEFTKKN